ncbi:MAG TPA: enoyl-CoA hydratase-related protein [Methylomirabilota bacterium]|nr:enoyl-CoA hydratase-related protein [Methylomirabilota bacterium]
MRDVGVERAGGLAHVTLDRPPLNILTPGLIAELGDVFRRLATEAEVRVIILRATGRAFSAGVEVQAMRDLDPPRARAFIQTVHDAIRALCELDAAVVARLHGHVLGGALELVLGADLRLAGASCRLGMPEIRVGIPSVIEAALLPGLIGWGRTAELLLTGETIGAEEAERWGLVNRVVADDALDAEVATWADRLLALPPDALRLQKALLRRWRRTDLDSAIGLSMEAFARAYATDEPRRAMQAFLDRRRETS